MEARTKPILILSHKCDFGFFFLFISLLNRTIYNKELNSNQKKKEIHNLKYPVLVKSKNPYKKIIQSI